MVADYTTLALVKDALEIADNTQDTLISAKITAASRQIDRFTGRRFYLDATAAVRVLNPARRVIRDHDGDRLLVADIGELTGFKVEVGREPDWTDITTEVETEPTEALVLDPPEPVTSLMREASRWKTRTLGRVRVTARWGWPAVPDVVREAALIQAVRLYKRKDSPEGVLGSVEWAGPIRMARIDPDVAALLGPLVIPGIG